MSKSINPKGVFCIVFVTLLGMNSFAQATSDVGRKSNYIKKLVDRYHYNSFDFNDSFSEKVFDGFIDEIDPLGLYFFNEDIETLKLDYYHSIDDEIKQSKGAFFAAVAAVFSERLNSSKGRLERIIDSDWDWDSKEYLSYLEADYSAFVSTEVEMNERWRKWLKYSILDELFSEDYHPSPTETTLDSVLIYESEAQESVLKMELYDIKSYLENPSGYKNFLSTFYLNTIATIVDPHTMYFSPNEQEDFVDELSRDNYAFGIQLDENAKGEVVIYSLVPGSPAWISNELNKGDQVLSLKLGESKTLDLSVSGLDDVNLLFESSNAEILTMKIRKANGQEKEVVLEKGVVYVDQDVIKSVILDGEKKVGYITLPDFYTDWGDQGTYGCANDVAKILVKLQKESIDGLILDLRNNGGGSLKEAIDLAGIFINYGPIGIVQEQTREPQSIKDFNKGSIYDGPMVVLVNGLSASASEIFSAAMQDYNRAIIVGSTTYGKSTGQVIMPLDPRLLEVTKGLNAPDESLGYLKITTSKYYRITKSTHQKEGVIPDVVLPDVYDIYDYRESAYKNALLKDSVDKKVYYTAFADFPLSQLKQLSQNRLNNSSFGNALANAVDSLKQVFNSDEKIPLGIADYQKQEQLMDLALEQLFSYIENKSTSFKVVNNQYDLRIMEMNAYRSELNEAYLERLSEDIYIDEAYRILSDYIKFGNN